MDNLITYLDSGMKIVIDSCITLREKTLKERTASISRELRKAEKYKDLDINFLQERLKDFPYAALVLSHENAVTLPLVSNEIRKLAKILDEEISELDKKESEEERAWTPYEQRVQNRGLVLKLEEQASGLADLSLERELRNRKVPINYPEYQSIRKIVELISLAKKIKKPECYSNVGDSLPNNRSSASKQRIIAPTDERIVATAIYLSTYEKKGVGIASIDGDIPRLLEKVLPLIGAGEFLPLNQKIRCGLHKNPIYLFRNNRAKISYKTRHYPAFKNFFEAEGIERKEYKRLKTRVSRALITFNYGYSKMWAK